MFKPFQVSMPKKKGEVSEEIKDELCGPDVSIDRYPRSAALTELLLAIEPEVSYDDNNLTHHCDPERPRRHRATF